MWLSLCKRWANLVNVYKLQKHEMEPFTRVNVAALPIRHGLKALAGEGLLASQIRQL